MLNFDLSPLATLGKAPWVNVREDRRAGKILIKATVLLTYSSIFNEIVQMSDPRCPMSFSPHFQIDLVSCRLGTDRPLEPSTLPASSGSGSAQGKKLKETRCVALGPPPSQGPLTRPSPSPKNHPRGLSLWASLNVPPQAARACHCPASPLPLLSSDPAIFHFLLQRISVAFKNR